VGILATSETIGNMDVEVFAEVICWDNDNVITTPLLQAVDGTAEVWLTNCGVRLGWKLSELLITSGAAVIPEPGILWELEVSNSSFWLPDNDGMVTGHAGSPVCGSRGLANKDG